MKKLLLTYILTIGICAGAGIGTGIILKKTIGPIDEMYPPGFDPTEFSPDIEAIMKKYDGLSNKTYDGAKGFTDAELVNVAQEKYKRCENCYNFSVGDAHTIVTQAVRNAQVKNGNEYFMDQISHSSMVTLAKRTYQHGADGQVEVYDGTALTSETASYPTTPTATYTPEEYHKVHGMSPNEMFIYIISDQTVLDSTRTTNGDDVVIKMNLNPNLSTYWYKYQMVDLSGLANLPPFSEVKLTYTLSKDLVLKHISVDETLTATKDGIPVPAKTQDLLELYYYADTYYKIPALDEPFDFSIKEA